VCYNVAGLSAGDFVHTGVFVSRTFQERKTVNRTTAIVLDWAIPVVILLGATVAFWTTDSDMAVERLFYEPGVGWTHAEDQPWQGLYELGVVPAWVLSLSALAVLIASRWVRMWAGHRRLAVFLVLVMIVGPGLVVNEVFKKHWGRPRPSDVYQLGGDRDFVPVWVKSPAGNGNSFASGHASTGFYLFAPFFFLRRRSKRWAVFFLMLGLFYGSLVGLARMIQGAHFPSDVVWAGGMVYLTGLAVHHVLRLDK
jgi:lipid A 4'-phosphatase